jgi:hypothetical protein
METRCGTPHEEADGMMAWQVKMACGSWSSYVRTQYVSILIQLYVRYVYSYSKQLQRDEKMMQMHRDLLTNVQLIPTNRYFRSIYARVELRPLPQARELLRVHLEYLSIDLIVGPIQPNNRTNTSPEQHCGQSKGSLSVDKHNANPSHI